MTTIFCSRLFRIVNPSTIHTKTNEYNCKVFHGTVDDGPRELSVSKAAFKHDK